MPFAAVCGDVLVGVRSNDEAVHEELRRRFGRLALANEAPNADYTLLVPPPASGPGPHPLHRLYWGNKVVATARHVEPLVDVLAGHLDGFAARADGDALLFDLVAVHSASGAALLPRLWRGAVFDGARSLARQGITVVHQPLVRIDTATGELLHGTPDVAGTPVTLLAAARVDASWRPADTLLLLTGSAHPADPRREGFTCDELRQLARLATLLPAPVQIEDLSLLTALVPASGR